MALIKYSRPNTDLFSKTFNDIVDEFFSEQNYRRDSFIPSVDISEDEKQFTISAALPGMKKDDITIDLENGRLTISGERKMEAEDNGRNYHRVESQFGSFSRSFYLPDTIDEDTVKASYEDGVLNITIEKSKQKVKKQIEIK
ncbi:Hsp20/alpha crystallin family protein [Balneola sp. MJW-20]|uniref:Hsp20/alpha crystallin family protein n=1 Tax=Gracilimonas aurantiaca TaxID=3234185 RepID=UPI003465A879